MSLAKQSGLIAAMAAGEARAEGNEEAEIAALKRHFPGAPAAAVRRAHSCLLVRNKTARQTPLMTRKIALVFGKPALGHLRNTPSRFFPLLTRRRQGCDVLVGCRSNRISFILISTAIFTFGCVRI
jgi:hypothetical protein